jgi:hypothetical protein
VPPAAFEGLRPAHDTSHARWVVAELTESPSVGFRVPDRYGEVVRIHHPLGDGTRWVDTAPDLVRPPAGATYPHSEDVDAERGSLDDGIVDRLVPLLAAATSTPPSCHYALWSGWGDFHRGGSQVLWSETPRWGAWSAVRGRLERARFERAQRHWMRRVEELIGQCPVLPWWGGRGMLLFDGPITAVTAIGTPWPALDDAPELLRRSPQWWWPEDRAWFVSSEIDDPWTYVGGPLALVEAILDSDLEAVRVRRDDPW